MTVETRIEPDLYARADETFYIRMLINLISNAVTYSKENGHVIVSLKRSGSEIIGCVEDDGIGIEPEHLPHIWERFLPGGCVQNRPAGGKPFRPGTFYGQMDCTGPRRVCEGREPSGRGKQVYLTRDLV